MPRALLILASLAVLAAPSPVRAQAGSGDDPPLVYGRKGESSIGILFGVGWYDNTAFNQALVDFGVEPIENGFEYGLQYRKHISSHVSLGAEIGRWDGRTTTLEGGGGTEFGLAGTPLFLDVFVHPLQVGGASLTLFAGGGPVFAVRLSQTFPDGVTVDGKKTAFGWQAGAEGEARFGENFGFFIRGMTRRAGAQDIVVSDQPNMEPITFDADFDGLAISFGPRWHWGSRLAETR